MGSSVVVDGGVHGQCRDTSSPEGYEIAVCDDALGSVTCWGAGSDKVTGLDVWIPQPRYGKYCVGAIKAIQKEG